MLVAFLMMSATVTDAYTLNITGYVSAVPAKVFWDGGGFIAQVNMSGCVWAPAHIRIIPWALLNTSNASEPFTLAASGALRLAAFPFSTAANNSLPSPTVLMATIRPAPGFVTATNIALVGAPVNSTLGSLCTGSASATNNVTILANPDGGFATFEASAINEFDIQLYGMNVTVTLRYNTFYWWPSTGTAIGAAPTSAVPTVITTGVASSMGSLINSSLWSLQLLSPYQLLAVYPPVPQFDLNATEMATVSFNISGLTYLPDKLPSPSGVGFTIISVDGTPLSFCEASVTTIYAGLLRSQWAVVLLTLDPPNKDFFINDTAAWDGVVPVPDSVRVSYTFMSSQTIKLNFSAPSTYFTDSPINMLFQVPGVLLQSRTAGCGFTRITIAPSSGVAYGPASLQALNEGLKVTEVTINEAETCLTFRTEFDRFLPGAAVLANVTRIVVNATLVDGLDANFSSSVAPYLFTRSVSGNSQAIDVCIPPTAAYNIPEGVVENVTLWFPGSSMVGGNPPVMVNASLLVTGVRPRLSVIFGSTGENRVNSTLLWSSGDSIILRLQGEKWVGNGTARNGTFPGVSWSVRSPLLLSSRNSLNPFRTSLRLNNVTLSNFSRDALVIMAASPGIAVFVNETFSVWNVSSLFACSTNSSCDPAPFFVELPLPSEISYTCGGFCGQTVNQSQIRLGFSFTVTAKYDQFDVSGFGGSPSNIIQNISLTSLGPYASTVMVSSSSFSTMLTFTFPPLPLFDFPFAIPVTSPEVLRVVPPAAAMKSRTVNPSAISIPMLMQISPSRHPVCTRFISPSSSSSALPSSSSSSNSVNEGDVRNSDVQLTVTSTLPFYPDICQSLWNESKAVGVIGNVFGLNITASPANCVSVLNASRGLNLTLIIAQNTEYDIAQVNTLRIELNLTFFTAVERCSSTLVLPIQVLPGTAVFTYTGVEPGSSALVKESTLRASGMNMSILLGGETPNQCWFILNRTVIVKDVVQPFTDFVALVPLKINATIGQGSTCVVNVTKQNMTFVVFFPRMPTLDVGMNEVINFSVPYGVNADLPTVINGQLTILAVSEILLAQCNGTDMLPPFSAVNRSENISSMMRLVPDPQQPTTQFVIELDAEALSSGGITFNFTLLGDEWLPSAPSLISSSLTITNETANNNLKQLFSSSIFSSNGKSGAVMLFFTAPPLPEFFVTIDHILTISIPREAVSSGILPTPSTFRLLIKSNPPVLVATGPALSGGTRELLLGQLFLTIQLQNDLFMSSSLSAFQVCPKEFDTCAISVDNTTRRILNITFPAQNIVLFVATTYAVNITFANIASGRNISNTVFFTLNVQSGILTTVQSVGQGLSLPVSDDTGAQLTEDAIRNGGLLSLRFSLQGDSFVGDPEQVVGGLLAGITCAPTGTLYGFCRRARSIISGNPAVVYVDQLKQQVISVALQADSLYDIYAPETVSFSFSGLSTTSGFATVTLSNMSVTIVPVAGLAAMLISRDVLTTPEILYGTPVPVLITIVLTGEQWVANATELLVASFASVSNLPRSFRYEQINMFLPLVVSATNRVGYLYLKPDPSYNAAANDTITFAVPASCVMSAIQPQLSGDRSLRITAPTAFLVSNSPPTSRFSAALFRSSREHVTVFNITIVAAGATSSDVTYQWNSSLIGNPGSAIASSLAPVIAPTGYSALQDSMAPTFANISRNTTLLIAIRPDSSYALQPGTIENLTLTIPRSWISPFVASLSPLQFTIMVTPDEASVVVIIPNSAQELQALQGSMSAFLSVPRSCVSLGTPNALFANTAYLNVSATVSCSYAAPTGSRTPAAAVEYFLSSASSLRRCCNISLATLPGEFVPTATILAAIRDFEGGPTVDDGDSTKASSTLWIYISIAGVVIVFITGAVLYWANVGSTFSGRNRTRREEPEIALQRLVLTELQEFSPPKASRSGTSAPFLSRSTLPEPSLADPSVANTEVDVDERLYAAQPAHVFGGNRPPRMIQAGRRHYEDEDAEKVESEVEQVMRAVQEQQREFLADPGVAVYPSTIDGGLSLAEHRKKFRPKRKPADDILL